MPKKSLQYPSAYNAPSVFSQKVLSTNPKKFKAVQSSGYGQIRDSSRTKNDLTNQILDQIKKDLFIGEYKQNNFKKNFSVPREQHTQQNWKNRWQGNNVNINLNLNININM